jgi:hypothetical protein
MYRVFVRGISHVQYLGTYVGFAQIVKQGVGVVATAEWEEGQEKEKCMLVCPDVL